MLRFLHKLLNSVWMLLDSILYRKFVRSKNSETKIEPTRSDFSSTYIVAQLECLPSVTVIYNNLLGLSAMVAYSCVDWSQPMGTFSTHQTVYVLLDRIARA